MCKHHVGVMRTVQRFDQRLHNLILFSTLKVDFFFQCQLVEENWPLSKKINKCLYLLLSFEPAMLVFIKNKNIMATANSKIPTNLR